MHNDTTDDTAIDRAAPGEQGAVVVPLRPGGAPGSETWQHREQEYRSDQPRPQRVVRNVAEPSLTVFVPRPETATGDGVVVCPGGAHHFLSVDHEGYEVAHWLIERGIAALVLKYRVLETPDDDAGFLEACARIGEPDRLPLLLREHWPLALADGQQAVRVARRRAAEWGLTGRVGMLGFSAGGHVAGGVALAGEADSRPDFVAPIYGTLWQRLNVPPQRSGQPVCQERLSSAGASLPPACQHEPVRKLLG